MGLIRYKTLKDARQGMMEAALSGGGGGRLKRPPRDANAAAPFLRSAYRSGVYRFKSWEEARRFDLEMMILGSCRRRGHDKP